MRAAALRHAAAPAGPRHRQRGAHGCFACVLEQKSDLIKRLLDPGEFQRVVAAPSSSDGAPAAAEAPAAEEPDPMAQMGQMGRQLVMLPVLWASNKIDWEEKDNILYLQIFFAAVLATGSLLLQFTLSKAEAVEDTGARVANPGTSQQFTKAEDGSVSVKEYDVAKLKETRGQFVMGGAICSFLHYKFGYVQPLLMTGIMSLFNLWDCKALHIHLLGWQAERPWAAVAANPLQQWAERKKAEAEAAQEQAKKTD